MIDDDTERQNPIAEPSGVPEAARVTPMMAQYLGIRAEHPDCLLFYRMGDFYELFFEDAAVAARHLGIALTRRGKHLGADIPMCGVPVHAADDYLTKLIAKGLRVAICEQTEDPAAARRRGTKSVVSRAVVRIVTPGTLTEDTLLDARRSHFLAALLPAPAGRGEAGSALAWLDMSTGAFRIGLSASEGPPENAPAGLLAALEPRELLVPERAAADPAVQALAREAGAALTPLPASFFDTATAASRLCALFGVATLDAFGPFTQAEIAAGAALVAYVEKTQVAARPAIAPPLRVVESDAMRIDPATRANLEMVRTVDGQREGSLLAAIDRTSTGAGARLLAERLASPLRDPAAINARLDAVAFFAGSAELRREVRTILDGAPDTERSLTRLSLGRGGPRDLDAIRAGLEAAACLAEKLQEPLPEPLARAATNLAKPSADLAARISAVLADTPPRDVADGGFVRAGADPALDAARRLRDDSRRVVATLQARYAEATGVRGLKIRHNNMLGYYVEVSAAQASQLAGFADGPEAFVHRQTMAGAMRYATAELAELERRIAGAADQALALERSIFDALVAAVLDCTADIRAAAGACAEIDVAAALAELAATERYVRPLVDNSLAFTIEGGRHPVVEPALRTRGGSFVGNDCLLGPPPGATGGERGRITLLTGPNMAGKSTYLRQNALIAILAQVGCFVPAATAHIGVVDAVFSRVGAADDLARGRSTFMVEMVETAAILNQAGERSLVILDEIGRGTATFDGLSIAWAAVEHLHDATGCRALFATHYHELTALAARLPRLANATMAVREWKGDVVFLHEVAPGSADRSYGIQVAKLAGLPAGVVARARQVLGSLERGDRSRPKLSVDDLPLFAAAAAPEPLPAALHPVLEALATIDPDALTPREALEQIYDLKRKLATL